MYNISIRELGLISCPHCGAVFDLGVMQQDHSKDRVGNQTYWIGDKKEMWYCVVCHSKNETGERK